MDLINEKLPLMNRMFCHTNLTTSPTAKKYSAKGGIPNFRFFQTAFRCIETVMDHFDTTINDTIFQKKELIQKHMSEDLLTTNLPPTILQELFTPMETDEQTIYKPTPKKINSTTATSTETTPPTKNQETQTDHDTEMTSIPKQTETRTIETQTERQQQ